MISGLGETPAHHVAAFLEGRSALRPLEEFSGLSESVREQCCGLLGAWIENRSLMLSRKWAPASMLSIEVARRAVEDAELSGEALRDAAIVVGTSRGNAWLSDWPGRRPVKLMAASNSMHGEVASAVSIELGVQGPWQVVSSACSASLDALGVAQMMLRCGVVKHAIVIGVELPIVDPVVQSYLNTGVLSANGVNDPYSPDTTGFFPGEAAAAIVLENSAEKKGPEVTGYWCNSDSASPIGMPEDGSGLRKCIQKAVAECPDISAVCPHASGTYLHGIAEQTALVDALPEGRDVSLHLMKPLTGHTVGSSGLLDTAILAEFLTQGSLPPNISGLTSPPSPLRLPTEETAIVDSTLLKIAVGMGGHNTVVSLRP